ncbi:MAG: DUF357 domain-containing protein [Methanobrevibacter sp.]|jgi:hypothetical protein|nr:DUF357 domain-containing protein [Candidatus Methanoflexus mossambicus]
MENKERINIDIEKLDKNLKALEEIKKTENIQFNDKIDEIIESAINYRDDSKYYLKKKEEFIALDAIAYAHGLIDALRMIYGIYE